jgi:hypothetical protein
MSGGPLVSPPRFGPRQAQPLDNLMGDAKDILEGLFAAKPDTKDLPPAARIAIETTQRIRAIAARKFADAEGEELLEALCDATMRRPVFITQLGLPSDQVLSLGQFREGTAAGIYLLLAWIAEGRSEQPPQREGATHVTSSSRRRRRAKPKSSAKSRSTRGTRRTGKS